MKDLIVAGSAGKRMSSMEIAELMGKQHKHVIRDIKSLIEQGAICESNFGLTSIDAPMPNGGTRKTTAYLLDFNATMTLITGYDAKRRAIVINRWQELEAKVAQPAYTLPTNYKEALLQLVDQVDKNEQLQLTISEQAPKVAALDRISTADGCQCITDAAKTLQQRPKDLFAWLQMKKWIYRRQGGKGWIAYQVRIQQGFLSHKVTTVTTSDGRERVIENVLVTPKGLARLAQVLLKLKVEGAAA